MGPTWFGSPPTCDAVITVEPITGRAYMLRFCADSDDPFPVFVASCVIECVGDSIAEIKILQGTLSRSLLRELLQTLHELGIKKVVARRVGKHTLPFATVIDGVHHVDIEALALRVKKRD
jgi:hypothetical protein